MLETRPLRCQNIENKTNFQSDVAGETSSNRFVEQLFDYVFFIEPPRSSLRSTEKSRG